MKRFWQADTTKKLNKPTTQFDACGAYDLKNGGEAIAKGSQKKEWSDALSFLEWYGIPHMEGFGIIIIDDENTALYGSLAKSDDGNNNLECFKAANYIKIGLFSVASAVAYSLY